MSHLLLPTEGSTTKSSNMKHKPTELPRLLFYIIRGSTDAVEALEVFLQLLSEPSVAENGTKLDGPGYLAFDAHVGDTACQLRACMLLEVTRLLKSSESDNTIDTIRSNLYDLKKVKESAQSLIAGLLNLDWSKIRAGGLEALSIPKAGMTTNELLAILGWSGVHRSAYRYDSRNASSSESLFSQGTPSSMGSSMCDSDVDWNDRSSAQRGSAVLDNGDEFDERQWSPSNQQQLVRFVVYSYILSKYKQLISFGGVYRATLRPELAFEAGQKLVQREFGRQFVRPNKRAVGEEFTSLQRYISVLSCTWLESQARKCQSLHPEHLTLLSSTVRISAKGVSSTSSYAGYLVLRSLWAEESTPIVIATTRFCPSGFHRNYFKVTMHTRFNKELRNLESPAIPDVSWELKRLMGADLERLSQSLEQHIIISGNSIDGNASDYYKCLPTAREHNDNRCCDNEKHCNDMPVSDQDRVVQAIFAEHRHYAFELPGGEGILGEDVVVQCHMDQSVPGLSTAWAKSKQEASILGTGPSYKLYMWQHVALESPARFLASFGGTDRPWIIGSVI